MSDVPEWVLVLLVGLGLVLLVLLLADLWLRWRARRHPPPGGRGGL